MFWRCLSNWRDTSGTLHRPFFTTLRNLEVGCSWVYRWRIFLRLGPWQMICKLPRSNISMVYSILIAMNIRKPVLSPYFGETKRKQEDRVNWKITDLMPNPRLNLKSRLVHDWHGPRHLRKPTNFDGSSLQRSVNLRWSVNVPRFLYLISDFFN